MSDLYYKISTSDQLGKAKLIVDLIDKENSTQAIELIKQKGFDNNYLAYMAI